MNAIETPAPEAATNHQVIKLPPIGTLLQHLGGRLGAIQRAKPGSGLPDYITVVPEGDEYETRGLAWGSEGRDEPGAACQWDGLANTAALRQSKLDHPFVTPIAALEAKDAALGLPALYVPSLRELKALFANGCEAFDPDAWYWSSTQYSRYDAFLQGFGNGYTSNDFKSWAGGRARFVRRFPIESLID
ncbi:MAG: hypothetical protein KIS62_01410 [Ramlibacter sp.]|nr:hypothetical protein [Ramlibacter sp.]